MTYAELVALVQQYLETDEASFVTNIPTFVKTVENRIYNEIQLPALRKNTIGEFTSGNKYLTLPDDFLAPFSLAAIDPTSGLYTYVLFKDVNLVREMYPSPTTQATPKLYGLFDANTAIIGPTPNKNYGAELHYFYYPESMVTAGDSWVSINFPSVILYGCLSEGYRYLKGDVAMQTVYDEQYKEALNLLRKLGEGRDRGDAYRDGQAKLKVS